MVKPDIIVPLAIGGAIIFLAPALKESIGGIGKDVKGLTGGVSGAGQEFSGVFENSFGVLNDALKGLRNNDGMIRIDDAQRSVDEAFGLGFGQGAQQQSDATSRQILDLRQRNLDLMKQVPGGKEISIQNDAMRQARGIRINNLTKNLTSGIISQAKFNVDVKKVPAQVFVENLKEQSGVNVSSRSPSRKKSSSSGSKSVPTIRPIKAPVKINNTNTNISRAPSVQKVVDSNKIVKLFK